MVGLVLGQFRLPLLIAALESTRAAVASNLAISSLGAVTGALAHAREGRVEVRLLLTIGAPSAIAAYVSSRMVTRIEAWWIEALIGVVLLLSATPMASKAWRLRAQALPATTSAEATAPADPPQPPERQPISPGRLTIEVIVGAALGALSGVVGLLLGTLRLPAMLRLGVSPAQAAGTNMAIGFFTGVGGTLGAVGSGHVSWLALAIVGAATLLGAWLGARRTKTLPTSRHLALIAGVLIGVGAWLIGKALLAR